MPTKATRHVSEPRPAVHDHGGILCRCDVPALCARIAETVRHVATRDPRTWAWIQPRITEFRTLTPDEFHDGTVGALTDAAGGSSKAGPLDPDAAYGVAFAPADTIATIAHVLGHVATTYAHLSRRQAPTDK